MTRTFEEFEKFYNDKNNWRPPSYTQLMDFMGWKSKNSVKKAVDKLKKQENENL